MSTIENAIRNKSIFELEHRVIQADGTFGWTHSRAVPLLNEQGEIVEWLGTASDVTQRVLAQEAFPVKEDNIAAPKRKTSRNGK